nr:MAG TPA: hypothetical protein [Caudoviricetes sp.]
MFFDRKIRPRCYSTGDGKRYKKISIVYSISSRGRKVNG